MLVPVLVEGEVFVDQGQFCLVVGVRDVRDLGRQGRVARDAARVDGKADLLGHVPGLEAGINLLFLGIHHIDGDTVRVKEREDIVPLADEDFIEVLGRMDLVRNVVKGLVIEEFLRCFTGVSRDGGRLFHP